LLEQLRGGDPEASRRFVRDYYPGVYRYLRHLTGRPEQAEDLTQETFLQAWRHLDTFAGARHSRVGSTASPAGSSCRRCGDSRRGHLSKGSETSPNRALERRRTRWNCEKRSIGSRWRREVVLLHYLEGYTSAEIARIVGAPASTVRYRLSQARERLRRELGEDDLAYLNEPLAPMRQWHWLPLDQMRALETRLSLGSAAGEEVSTMERRQFLRQAAAGVAGLMLPESEKEIVDDRLAQKVTLAFKGAALSDLCARLRADTGVHLTAGASVADEKVTLFCEKMPLRDVMRQLSRPFGYTWLRSSTPDARRLTPDGSEPRVRRQASSPRSGRCTTLR
jgi:RNA polymerase sigma-70 factor (ECF subfamily)